MPPRLKLALENLRILWRARPRLVLAFAAAVLLACVFLGNILDHSLHWQQKMAPNGEIKGWMTVGVIARAYGVDAAQIDALAGLPTPEVKGHPQPLREIATDRGQTVQEVITEVQAAIAQIKAAQP